MKISQCCRYLISSFLLFILLSGCHPSPRDLTVVSGKTVYGDLALEDVQIEIFRLEKSEWRYYSETRSGYHGSFRTHLPPGEYRLTAAKTIRLGQEEVLVTGTLEDLILIEAGGRMDQVVIVMDPARGP
jgi:hypothetical protein